jgi:hypothetical protein
LATIAHHLVKIKEHAKIKIKTPRLDIKIEFRSFVCLSIVVTRVNDPSKVR